MNIEMLERVINELDEREALVIHGKGENVSVSRWDKCVLKDCAEKDEQNTTLTERVGKLTEALEFTVNQIDKRVKYKPSNSAQGGIDARDKVCFNDAVQILKDNKEK